ncbi:rhodanese-like domain-containing protein [Tundrisphaera sp. TA3]|uniref:rhodanese-like domain-containing protein n=1 Tax=Tundrisphaera sp. TA3 TaxID=3435775 RepID=UPI003EBFB6F2
MGPKSVTPDEVKQMLRDGQEVAFLDVREPEEWDASEMILPAAIRVPPDRVEPSLARIPHGRPIVVYGSKARAEAAPAIADRLLAHGWEAVHALEGGFEAWADSGHPVEEKQEG